MDAIVEKYASRTAPRYTSYPTVPHFTTGFPDSTYSQWLTAIDPRQGVSLYIHVPYCKQLCWYCGCNMKMVASYKPVTTYIATLLREITMVGQALPGRLTVDHLHWGGGTPTALKPDDLERVMVDLRRRFDFAPGAELAIESDPRTLSDAMIGRIGALGFTRASFGVQEFDPQVQVAINRVQPPDVVRRAVEGLRSAGVMAVNFDLIYGLPRQTVASLTRTIEICNEMRPDRFALFGYAHVPWMAKKQRLIDELALPGPAARLSQAKAAAQRLTECGYRAIGLDHFARPDDPLAVAAHNGTLHRNFQGYTTDRAETLIGFGATSIGRTPSGYVQNIAETRAWARAVAAGHLPVAKGHALTADDKVRAHVIERLMCDGTVDTVAVAHLFGQPDDWCAEELEDLGEMAKDGLLTVTSGCVRMTESGLPFVRLAATAFDSYHRRALARHSVAV